MLNVTGGSADKLIAEMIVALGETIAVTVVMSPRNGNQRARSGYNWGDSMYRVTTIPNLNKTAVRV